MRFRGMTRRWFFYSFVIIIIVIAIIALFLCRLLHNYYYDGVETLVKSYADSELEKHFVEPYDSDEDFERDAREYTQKFAYKDKMEVSVINEHGAIMFSSLGYDASSNNNMEDYQVVFSGDEEEAVRIVTLPTGEKVMALTRKLPIDHKSDMPRALRFIVSLESIDTRIYQSYAAVFLACVIIVAIALVPGMYFIRSVVGSVKNIQSQTAIIAQGNFDVRIPKKYNDEIGELSESINNMAVELSKIDKMKYDFISTVSHELRTPLTAIRGWGETLISIGADNPEIMEKGLRVIVDETDRLSNMVEELLSFSKMQGDHFKMEFKETDLIAKLNEAYYMFRERAEREGKTLEYETSGTVFLAMADGEKIKQVFVNVIDNAIKYTPAGGKISVAAECCDRFITVSISDTGRGISKEDLPYVLNKFYKGSNSLSGSSGIGLAVANEVIKQHKGELKVESVLGEGTTVYITLPIKSDESEG